MRVVGGEGHFQYGPKAGDAGCFLARLHHASVRPESEREHLKARAPHLRRAAPSSHRRAAAHTSIALWQIAFFFRRSRQQERRGSSSRQ
jgi:hypothetical protein